VLRRCVKHVLFTCIQYSYFGSKCSEQEAYLGDVDEVVGVILKRIICQHDIIVWTIKYICASCVDCHYIFILTIFKFRFRSLSSDYAKL